MKKLTLYCIMLLTFLTAGCLQAFDGEFRLGGQSFDVHGFISQGYLYSENNNVFADTEDGTFQFNEAGLNVATDLTERLRAGLQVFSRDLGDLSNNELALDWAYADYRWRDWLGLRAGKIKIPYGLYNETRDIDLLRTAIFLPSSIYYEGDRDVVNAFQGIGLYGDISLRRLGSFSYQIQAGDKEIENDSGVVRYGKDDFEFTAELEDIDLDTVYTFDLIWDTPLPGLRVKGFFLSSEQSWKLTVSSTDDEEGISENMSFEETQNLGTTILSAEYTWENFLLSAEFLTTEEEEEGYYAALSYRLTDWLECGAYYSVFYKNKNDKDGSKGEADGNPAYRVWQKEWVLTTRFDLNEHWTWKVETHLINGTAQMLQEYNPGGSEEDSYLFAVKSTYHF